MAQREFVTEDCPVCLEPYSRGRLRDSPVNHGGEEMEDNCGHYVCVYCLWRMKQAGRWHCPVCRACWCKFFQLCVEKPRFMK